jgi:hypothetical protein
LVAQSGETVVEQELTDDTPIKQELMELQMLLELGDIDDDEYVERERAIMKRLREVREWKEKLGQSTQGGPVRVARDTPRSERPASDRCAPRRAPPPRPRGG